MASHIRVATLSHSLLIDEARLQRFARLAAPIIRGTIAKRVGPHAALNRAGTGLEFLDLHPYMPGEDARNIDWRQSARRRHLVARRYRDEAASDWFLCVDGSASMRNDGKWRLVCELAAALAYLFVYAGHRVALLIFAERLHAHCSAGRGQRQFSLVTRELDAYRPPQRGGASLPGLCASMTSKTGNIVLLSDFLREDTMRDDLRRLRAKVSTASAIQVLADDEIAVSVSGPATLRDVESGAGQYLQLDPATTAAAAIALSDHNQRLRRLLASLGMPLSISKAGDAWDRVLLTHLGS